MIILVCGGRNYINKAKVRTILDWFDQQDLRIIQGGASGADSLAWEWAMDNKVDCITVKADWDKYGKMAGPIRNKEMIDKYNPDLVLAFNGGIGTQDMIDKAKKCGIVVLVVD